MKKAYFDKQITISIPNVVKMFADGLALKRGVSRNVVINAMIDYAIAESTGTELDAYVQRNQDLKTGKLVLEDEDE